MPAMEKVDYKKRDRGLYLPGRNPVLVDVPAMNFLMVDGRGAPEGSAYQEALSILYALSFTVKMSKLSPARPEDYFEYVVPPLEGLWWEEGGGSVMDTSREEWRWTAMIRQPEFVTPEVFAWAAGNCQAKKPGLDLSRARFETFEEGRCVQVLHVGPYAAEKPSFEKMERFVEEQGLRRRPDRLGRHHEIYLSNPQKTAPERLKTILRLELEG